MLPVEPVAVRVFQVTENVALLPSSVTRAQRERHVLIVDGVGEKHLFRVSTTVTSADDERIELPRAVPGPAFMELVAGVANLRLVRVRVLTASVSNDEVDAALRARTHVALGPQTFARTSGVGEPDNTFRVTVESMYAQERNEPLVAVSYGRIRLGENVTVIQFAARRRQLNLPSNASVVIDDDDDVDALQQRFSQVQLARAPGFAATSVQTRTELVREVPLDWSTAGRVYALLALDANVATPCEVCGAPLRERGAYRASDTLSEWSRIYMAFAADDDAATPLHTYHFPCGVTHVVATSGVPLAGVRVPLDNALMSARVRTALEHVGGARAIVAAIADADEREAVEDEFVDVITDDVDAPYVPDDDDSSDDDDGDGDDDTSSDEEAVEVDENAGVVAAVRTQWTERADGFLQEVVNDMFDARFRLEAFVPPAAFLDATDANFEPVRRVRRVYVALLGELATQLRVARAANEPRVPVTDYTSLLEGGARVVFDADVPAGTVPRLALVSDNGDVRVDDVDASADALVVVERVNAQTARLAVDLTALVYDMHVVDAVLLVADELEARLRAAVGGYAPRARTPLVDAARANDAAAVAAALAADARALEQVSAARYEDAHVAAAAALAREAYAALRANNVEYTRTRARAMLVTLLRIVIAANATLVVDEGVVVADEQQQRVLERVHAASRRVRAWAFIGALLNDAALAVSLRAMDLSYVVVASTGSRARFELLRARLPADVRAIATTQYNAVNGGE